MMVWTCCVQNCNIPRKPFHRFPIYYKNLYLTWLENIGNPILFEEDPGNVYYTYLVCDRHFTRNSKMLFSSNLRRDAVPTLHLPGYNPILRPALEEHNYSKDPIMEEFCKLEADVLVLRMLVETDHNYTLLSTVPEISEEMHIIN